MANRGPQGNHDEEIAERGQRATDIDTDSSVPVNRDDGKESTRGLNDAKGIASAIESLGGQTFFEKLLERDFNSLSTHLDAVSQRGDGFSVNLFSEAFDLYQESNGMMLGDEIKRELQQDYPSTEVDREFQTYLDSGILTDTDSPTFTGEAIQVYSMVDDLLEFYDEENLLEGIVKGHLDPMKSISNRHSDARASKVSSDLSSLSYRDGDGMRALLYIDSSPSSASADYDIGGPSSDAVQKLISTGQVEDDNELTLTDSGRIAYQHVESFYTSL